jgi:elongator complex protein 3 (tRNA carboxymethyluridine synthase)
VSPPRQSRAPTPASRRAAFDPAPHRREIAAILEAVARASTLDARELDRILKRHPRQGRALFSRSQLIAGLRAFGAPGGLAEAALLERLRLRPVRTLSGVTPVTVLTKPFPCPGRCSFCPSDVRMPKSYLADEPGAQRAEANGFDPYLQTWNRLDAYRATGHPVDKVELIALGGTWSFYPEPYQRWFVTRCLEALSDYGSGLDRRAGAGAAPADYRRIAPAAAGRSYNGVVAGHLRRALGGELLHESERASWSELEAAKLRNETASCRCVGLVLETRPDQVGADEALRMRRLGATKVQLGIQSLDDGVLSASRRGHDVACSRRAVRTLRAAGFKLHAHWMVNLPGATPAGDAAGYARLFAEPDFRPDELKLYPCLLVESADLVHAFRRGDWRPYDDRELLELLAACMAATPRWCRLTRVVRDFSSHDIVAGTRRANLREEAERLLAARGTPCRDVRAREIRGARLDPAALRLRACEYATSGGEEHFLEFATRDDRLVAFLRLSLPHGPAPARELDGSALIREVHVYGASLPLGARGPAPQHAGLGRALVREAARRAASRGYRDLGVISAIGTRPWYRALGFADDELYQHLPLMSPPA